MGLETEKADVQLFMADDAYSHHSGVDYVDPEKYVDSSQDRDPHRLNSHLKVSFSPATTYTGGCYGSLTLCRRMPLQVLPNSGHWSYWHPVDPDTQPSGSLNNQECCPNSCVPTVTLGNAGNSLPYFLQTFPVYSASSPPTPADSLDDWLGPCVLSLQLGFEDLIAEPENTHSFDKVWICSHALYEISKYVIYKFLTVFLAIPLAFVAGILFATLSCLHIW